MGNLAVHRLLLDKHTHIIHFLLWQVLIQFILCLFLRLHTHNCSLLTLSAITHPRNFGTRGRVCQRPSLDLGMGPWVLFKSFISFWKSTAGWFPLRSTGGDLRPQSPLFSFACCAFAVFNLSRHFLFWLRRKCLDGGVGFEVIGTWYNDEDQKSSCLWLSCPVSICTMTKPMKRLRWIWIEEWPTQIFAPP